MAVPPINVNISIDPEGHEWSSQSGYPQISFRTPTRNRQTDFGGNNVNNGPSGFGGRGQNRGEFNTSIMGPVPSPRRGLATITPAASDDVREYNERLAHALEEYGGGNPQEFRYHLAAEAIAAHPRRIMTAAQARREITGVGEHISWALDDILASGDFVRDMSGRRSRSASESSGFGAGQGQDGQLNRFNQSQD